MYFFVPPGGWDAKKMCSLRSRRKCVPPRNIYVEKHMPIGHFTFFKPTLVQSISETSKTSITPVKHGIAENFGLRLGVRHIQNGVQYSLNSVYIVTCIPTLT